MIGWKWALCVALLLPLAVLVLGLVMRLSRRLDDEIWEP